MPTTIMAPWVRGKACWSLDDSIPHQNIIQADLMMKHVVTTVNTFTTTTTFLETRYLNLELAVVCSSSKGNKANVISYHLAFDVIPPPPPKRGPDRTNHPGNNWFAVVGVSSSSSCVQPTVVRNYKAFMVACGASSIYS